MARPKPVVLIILDGWGVAPPGRGNAIALAKTPNMDRLASTYFTVLLQAAGEAVGALWGDMGNSEIGHLNIGAGRIVYQDVQRINSTIASGAFLENPILKEIAQKLKKTKGTLHIMGLLSIGHVHASFEHYAGMLEAAQALGVEKLACHVWLDGRDAPYASGIESVKGLTHRMQTLGVGAVASIAGRWWAMDRDNRWERTSAAYEAMVHGKAALTAEDPVHAIEQQYAQHVFDEEFPPTVIVRDGKPVAPLAAGDAVVVVNFRADRVRQITQALSLPAFTKFERGTHPQGIAVATMTQYDAHLPVRVLFPPKEVKHCLAETIAEHGLKQLHIAETEKYAHVTYFFNSGREDPYPGEQNTLVPSPQVSSYDQQPAMAAEEIKDKVLTAITERTFDVIIINFANADMVAHTGNLEATVEAVEILDRHIGEIVDVVVGDGGAAVITADHGNAEGLLKPLTGEIDKEHSAQPVPCIVAGEGWKHAAGIRALNDLAALKPSGVLADIAPTMLALLQLPQPVEMTGRSLV
ncbi:phosphoglycerate mutase (2,3-diphosphoglycerate-independent) [Candidatus Uhrbacteria bacterium RIFCSPHIGHO2_12_FULL_54_23]|uniref:2,3-bisphosphoglycerate-independent phosphoglycerate mutase n=1 Tax=Candidatus Uhrbacteria bacterium RIFCSPHIGHO2_12_FULL_54_23 TaxID=1802397 RepID=A0A1F7UNI9_9BACT|nr:MAG: phosphoglycerate mutase (2,3-diphosphoglycerate-independent) [Candidatus Uhrbacteria bacterium RIFCSPHIGHO2_12_FULL_54_23]